MIQKVEVEFRGDSMWKNVEKIIIDGDCILFAIVNNQDERAKITCNSGKTLWMSDKKKKELELDDNFDPIE